MVGKRRHLPVRAWPLWLSDQFNDRSVLIIIFLAVLVVAGLAALTPAVVSRKPLPVTRVEGQIVGLGFMDIKGRGSVPQASVEVEDHIVRIEMPARLNCRTGDRIVLDRITTRSGYFVSLTRIPDPCRRLSSRPDELHNDR